MKLSGQGRPQPNARNAFGFAHLQLARDFSQRGPLAIALADDKLGTTARPFVKSFAGLRGSR